MIKRPKKISDTSTRVLETLKLLVKNSASIQDIINYFEKIDPKNRIYTNEVILKYINTLKVFGFKFVKEKDKYVLVNPPNQLNFDEKDLRAICLIEKYSELIPEEKFRTEIAGFLQELERRFSEKTKILSKKLLKTDAVNINSTFKRHALRIKEYEKFCQEGLKLKVRYIERHDAEVSIIVEPNEIKYIKKSVFLSVYNPIAATVQDIDFDNILEVNQLPSKVNPTTMHTSVTFKLKDRLATGYRLYEGERLLQKEKNGNIVVLNQKEDKTQLLKRLLRYGENCEVLSPKNIRDEMLCIINEMLLYYL